MEFLDLILTVCALANPNFCEEKHLLFASPATLNACAATAPPYIAEWIGKHPQWRAVRWRCNYPHAEGDPA